MTKQTARSRKYTSFLAKLFGKATPTVVVAILMARAKKVRNVPSGKCFGRILPVGMSPSDLGCTLNQTRQNRKQTSVCGPAPAIFNNTKQSANSQMRTCVIEQ